jgi:uncharacterized protein (UPF0335 family)
MPASVESYFRLYDRATDPLKKIRDEAKKTDASMRLAGESVDKLGGRETQRKLGGTSDSMRRVGQQSQQTGRQVRDSMQQSERAVTQSVDRSVSKLERLHAALKDIDGQKAKATAEWEVAKFDAQTRYIKQQIRSVAQDQGLRELKANMGSVGLAADDLGAKMGGDGGGCGWRWGS